MYKAIAVPMQFLNCVHVGKFIPVRLFSAKYWVKIIFKIVQGNGNSSKYKQVSDSEPSLGCL